MVNLIVAFLCNLPAVLVCILVAYICYGNEFWVCMWLEIFLAALNIVCIIYNIYCAIH